MNNADLYAATACGVEGMKNKVNEQTTGGGSKNVQWLTGLHNFRYCHRARSWLEHIQ